VIDVMACLTGMHIPVSSCYKVCSPCR